KPPVRATYDFFEVPGEFAARLRSDVGHGTVEASNLQPHAGQEAGVADPQPSSFWVRPARIGELDLYHGFGRTADERFGATIWNYVGPKRGTGMNPGFNAKAGGVKIRVKFGETKSEPFAAR